MKTKTEPRIDESIRDLIPPLRDEELSELRESILREGVREALVVWKEEGILLDGHHRLRICEETSPEIPYRVATCSFASRDDAVIWVAQNQLGRRNLSLFQRGQLAKVIEDAFKRKAKANQRVRKGRQPGASSVISPNLIEPTDAREEAAKAVGIGSQTLSKVSVIEKRGSAKLIAAARDGDISIDAAYDLAKDEDLSKRDQDDILERGRGGVIAAAKELKRKRAAKRKAAREEANRKAAKEKHPLAGERYQLHHLAIDELEEKLEVASVSAIICDPPYPEEFLPLYATLGRLAEKVLRSGGHLLAMAGQSHLHEVFRLIASDTPAMRYQWTLCYYTPGHSTQVFGRKVKSNWKPVLWLTKGKNQWENVDDVVRSDRNDKRFHEWGQSVGGMAQLILRFTTKGDVVLDPFVGGGATAVAAVELGRPFIGADRDKVALKKTAKRLDDQAKTQRK